MNPPNYFADDVNLFLYSKIDPQKEFTAGITKIILHAIPWTLLLRQNGHTLWVLCMTARGEEEAGGNRQSAMCSQTLRGAAVGAVWN